jgi:hypothetical protein
MVREKFTSYPIRPQSKLFRERIGNDGKENPESELYRNEAGTP